METHKRRVAREIVDPVEANELLKELRGACVTFRRAKMTIGRVMGSQAGEDALEAVCKRLGEARGEQVRKVVAYCKEHPEASVKMAAFAIFENTPEGYPNYRALSAFVYSHPEFDIAVRKLGKEDFEYE